MNESEGGGMNMGVWRKRAFFKKLFGIAHTFTYPFFKNCSRVCRLCISPGFWSTPTLPTPLLPATASVDC